MPPDDGWTSPSELADYAYCPRSHWYARHPPARGPSSASVARSRAGSRYHARVLAAERRRAEHRAAYWAVLVVGGLLAVGGFLWIFRP